MTLQIKEINKQNQKHYSEANIITDTQYTGHFGARPNRPS
jgi:hypothetical protein